MNEKLRIKIIGIFLIAVVVWAGFNYQSESTDFVSETPKTIQPLDPNNNVNSQGSTLTNLEEIEKAPWGKSPFFIVNVPTANTNKPRRSVNNNNSLSWILSGIIFNTSSPTAIINKRPVKIGETIDKAIVTNIEKEIVTIKYNQREITLKVSKG